MSTWPKQTPAALNAFYGDPDSDKDGHADPPWEIGSLKGIVPPYRMVLAWDPGVVVKTIRLHRKCADSLLRVLTAIAKRYETQEEIEQARLHLYGGAYNFRLMRGSTRLSTHSWGCAIDLDPDRNALGRRWDESRGMMPRAVVDIFASEGWTWGGRWSRPDAMHFQAADI